MESKLTLYGGLTLGTLAVETKCACCGETFGRTPQWYWKYGSKWVCSYRCMRKMEREDPRSALNMIEKYRAEPEPVEVKPPVPVKKNCARMTKTEREKIAQDHREGVSVSHLARKYRRCRKTIIKVLEGYGVTVVPEWNRITAEKHARILELWAEGLTTYDIADTLNISQTAVQRHIHM